jgi:hypothetical protein
LAGFMLAENTVDQLQQTARAKSDAWATMEMREAKRKLFARFHHKRTVENEENQTKVSLRFPQPLEITARFPHSYRPGGHLCFKTLKTKLKKGDLAADRFAPAALAPWTDTNRVEKS